MTVQDLRETLTRLVGLLEAADAKAATTRGLTEFVESTADFGELNLKAFVKLAEVGRTPATPKPPAARRPSAKMVVDAATVAAEVKDLYERAADPTVTEEQMRAACKKLPSLAKGPLVQLANDIGLVGMGSKTKVEIFNGITNRLVDRKGATIRRHLIDRPDGQPGLEPTQGERAGPVP